MESAAVVGSELNPNDRQDDDDQPDEAPETPLDEPAPPHVEDPPVEPGGKAPYVVRAPG